MTLTEERVKLKDGSFISNILVEWTAVSDDQILRMAHHLVQTSLDGGATYKDAGTVDPRATSFRINVGTVKTNVTYVVRIKTVSTEGRQSPGVTDQITITGKGTPCSDVEDFRVQQLNEGLVFQWSAIDDADLFGYELRAGNINSVWETAGIIATEILSNKFTVANYSKGQKKWFVKAIDNSGNYSENAATVTFYVTRLFRRQELDEPFSMWAFINSNRGTIRNNNIYIDSKVTLSANMDAVPTNDFDPKYYRLTFMPKTKDTWLSLQQAGGTWADLQNSSFKFGLEKFVTSEESVEFGIVQSCNWDSACIEPFAPIIIIDVGAYSHSNLGSVVVEIAREYPSVNPNPDNLQNYEKFENGVYFHSGAATNSPVDYNPSYFRFRVKLQAVNEDAKVRLHDLNLIIQMPVKDVFLPLEDIPITGRAYYPKRDHQFAQIKNINAQTVSSFFGTPGSGETLVSLYTNNNGTDTFLPQAFNVFLFNLNGDKQAGTVDLHISGY